MPKNKDFPQLTPQNHRVTSPETEEYNCIAWAAGEQDRFWWPVYNPTAYWPLPIPQQVTVRAFVEAFGTLGYQVCGDGALEDGFEKVALYVDQRTRPTHMARQCSDGTWTSKLGQSFDISHNTPRDVNGPKYGFISTFMKRRRN